MHQPPISYSFKSFRNPRLTPVFTISTITSTHPFTTSSRLHLRTTELTPSTIPTLRSTPSRLWSDIHNTSTRFGQGRRYGPSDTQTGLTRLTLTDSDRDARAWFIETTRSLGCTTTVDSIGNIFAVRPGLNNDVPATFVGSHLDSQPLGGRFDGVLGVCAGVEMLRVLNDNWIETEGPVGVVNWTNEEGARFPVSMMGSGVWAGARDLQEIYDLKEVNAGEDGKRRMVKGELERIGYLGDVDARVERGGVRMAGHFELHIEQGPKLIREGLKVGAVKGVQAYKWFEINVYGRACHTGTTGFEDRADPLLFTSKFIAAATEQARVMGGLASVGVIRAEPGSVNTVTDHVMFTLDIRHEEDEKLENLLSACRKWIEDELSQHNEAASQRGTPLIKVDVKETFDSKATKFHDVAIDCIEQSAKGLVGANVPRMVSGAGHDSVNTARHCPTAMIFVPCKNGVSHHPEEWCEEEDCAIGTDVVIQSVLRFDKWRHEQGHFAG